MTAFAIQMAAAVGPPCPDSIRTRPGEPAEEAAVVREAPRQDVGAAGELDAGQDGRAGPSAGPGFAAASDAVGVLLGPQGAPDRGGQP